MDPLVEKALLNIILSKLLLKFIRNHIINRQHDFYDPYDRRENDNYYDWDDDSLENMYQD